MDRDEALALVNTFGVNKIMTQNGLILTDEATGYGPVLDRAFSSYINLMELTTGVGDTVIADADLYGFYSVLRASTYDLVLPYLALSPDISVDAPLINVKFSQAYRAMRQLRDDAWSEAAAYGYNAEVTNVGGFVVNLDFNERMIGNGQEYG